MTQHHDDEDMDSILSSIIHGQRPPSDPSVPTEAIHEEARPAEERPAAAPSKIIGIVLAAALMLATTGAIWFIRSGTLESLLSPPSPFTAEHRTKMGVPLYYPTKMPGTFKIEVGGMDKQAQNNVFGYVISNDEGKFLTINQQPKPGGVDIGSLFSALSDTRSIETPVGTAKSGVDKEAGNRVITYMSTDRTWIIISMGQDTLSNDELNLLLGSIKEG